MTYRTTCKYCGKTKKIPETMQKGVYPEDFMEDDYCTRDCCEADYAEQKEKEKAKKAKKPRTMSGAKGKRKEDVVISSIHEG